MSAYVVNVVTNQAELVVCELYASYSLASSRALALARACAVSNPLWVNPNAPEEKMEDGSIRWIYLETSRFLVTVSFKHVKDYLPASDSLEELRNNSNFIKFGDSLKNSVDTVVAPVIAPTGIVIADGYHQSLHDTVYQPSAFPVAPVVVVGDSTPPAPVLPPDKFNDSTLPFGFSISGKPITMEEAVNDPFMVAFFDTLTENKEWAIVTARVKKRPSFSVNTKAGLLNQQAALKELNEKTAVGVEIRDNEISLLANTLSSLTEEESSSSSSEEY